MTVNYARFENNGAWLSSDFGQSIAARYFTPEQIESLGRYVRGKRKGLLKGRITWTKCVHGGWVRTGSYDHDFGQASGYVELRVGKIIEAVLETAPYIGESIIVAEYHLPR